MTNILSGELVEKLRAFDYKTERVLPPDLLAAVNRGDVVVDDGRGLSLGDFLSGPIATMVLPTLCIGTRDAQYYIKYDRKGERLGDEEGCNDWILKGW